MSTRVNANSVAKGFHKTLDPQVDREGLLIGLIHTEVSEAMEAHRTGDLSNMAEEFADIIIRVLDLAKHFNIDIQNAILRKMAINEARPTLHNKRY